MTAERKGAVAMTEVEQFLDEVIPRQITTDLALQNGDPTLRIGMWSDQEPLTLFGAWLTADGVDDVRAAFGDLAARFSGSRAFEVQVIAAGVSGDLGYTVAYEHCRLSVDGVPATLRIRVTHVYRREDGVWRIVHRHGDMPTDPPPDA